MLGRRKRFEERQSLSYSSFDMYTGNCDPPNFRLIKVVGLLQFALSSGRLGSNVSFLLAEKSSSYGLCVRGYSARLQSRPYLSLLCVFSS